MAVGWRENNIAKWIGIRPAFTGNQINVEGGAGGASTTIYTAPAGKKLYLFDWSLGFTTEAVGTISIGHYTSGSVIIRRFALLNQPVIHQALMPIFGSFSIPVEINAG